MPTLHLFQRANSSALTFQSPITIAGVALIAFVLLGLCLWLGFRIYRRRAAAKRESKMGAAFLSVKGLVQDNGSRNETNVALPRSKTLNNGFSREMINSTIILPEKATINLNSVVSRGNGSGPIPGPIPRPFARTPISFTPSARPRSPALDYFVPKEKSPYRSSFVSFTSSQNRFSVLSGTSTISSTSGTNRKVRQQFNPVLPDELLPSIGEQLTVVQSFDDGWCVVGRENSTFAHTAKSLFKSSPEPRQKIEIGVVPTWCFLKPVMGLRAERPIRSSSLGITVNLDEPGVSSRNEVMSWSNF